MANASVSGGAARGPAAQGLFTRQSSGLVRELGIPAATAISLASVAVVNTYIQAANANFTATYFPFLLTALGAAFNSSSITDAAGNVTSQTAVAIISVGMM